MREEWKPIYESYLEADVKGKWPIIPPNKLIRTSVGNGTEWRVGLFKTRPGKCLVAIERKGCFEFITGQFYSWDYVAEKLNMSESDARNIADFLNTQIGDKNYAEVKQGTYHSAYCSGGERDDSMSEL